MKKLKPIKDYILTGDFCTNSPDKIFGYDLKIPCAIHDAQYSKKITNKQKKLLFVYAERRAKNRKTADTDFKFHVEYKSNRTIAFIMYYSVRMFGAKYYRK